MWLASTQAMDSRSPSVLPAVRTHGTLGRKLSYRRFTKQSVPGSLPSARGYRFRHLTCYSEGEQASSTQSSGFATWPIALVASASCLRQRTRTQRPTWIWKKLFATKLVNGKAHCKGTTLQASQTMSANAETSTKKGNWAKMTTFWACFFGYSVCYFTRQSLNYTAPVLKQAMGWDSMAELGQLASLFPLAYGSSRFLGGVLGDRMSPRKVFALGLTICGGLNIAFGLSSSLPMFAAIWFLNGCFQGLAAPPCVKMITNWFDPKERGFWWSIWHASINLGGFLIPFLSGHLAETFGWRFGMLGPGGLALVTAMICFTVMRDGPEDMGAAKAEPNPDTKATQAQIPDEKVSITDGLLRKPEQWALGVAYLLVYVGRQGLGVWGIFFLMHSGAANAAKAAALISGFELGGFFGNLTGGALSDFFLRRAKPENKGPGQRAKVVSIYFAAACLLLPALAKCPGSWPLVQYGLLIGIGHFLCGAQLLLPLVAAEVAPKSLTATATGFIGWVGYFGAASAGLPLSWVVTKLGWSYFFMVLTAAAGIGTALTLPLGGLKSWKQSTEEGTQAVAQSAGEEIADEKPDDHDDSQDGDVSSDGKANK